MMVLPPTITGWLTLPTKLSPILLVLVEIALCSFMRTVVPTGSIMSSAGIVVWARWIAAGTAVSRCGESCMGAVAAGAEYETGADCDDGAGCVAVVVVDVTLDVAAGSVCAGVGVASWDAIRPADGFALRCGAEVS